MHYGFGGWSATASFSLHFMEIGQAIQEYIKGT